MNAKKFPKLGRYATGLTMRLCRGVASLSSLDTTTSESGATVMMVEAAAAAAAAVSSAFFACLASRSSRILVRSAIS